ncbi:MAG: GtrA family protein [Candidatus Tectomicrobia bacterium]|nr:GtrA family protein [Candidatus Tectomicrobia bacterium]
MLLTTVALRYAAFAVLATATNVATQFVAGTLYDGAFELYVAMAAGTATGLVVKYVLDRRWIFLESSTTLQDHTMKFLFYSFTGVLTTCIFWATELAFVAMGEGEWRRYTGAVCGLVLGYWLKYALDKRFVFAGSTK